VEARESGAFGEAGGPAGGRRTGMRSEVVGVSTEPPISDEPQSSAPDEPLLDSNCDNRTRRGKALSDRDSPDEDSGGESDSSNWNRQQKRTFHRVNTLLHYWESRGYQIRWVALTSSPGSDNADRLAYNARRLRQTIERARLAYDSDGSAHSLGHIDEIEHLTIRTSEGPEGKGVLHLFWAWKPHAGHHSRDFFVPHEWLKNQWGRIHGPYDEHDEEPVKPLHVWIEEYAGEDYHDRKHVARYAVNQYLGEHGEALEHISWSHGRTLGGSLVEAWEAVREHTMGLETAVATWEKVIAGESVALESRGEHVDYGLTVEPPPNLGVTERRAPSISPPEDYKPQGPERVEFLTRGAPLPEYDPAKHERWVCPECGEYGVVEPVDESSDERVSFRCTGREISHAGCGTDFARPGEGKAGVVQKEFTAEYEPPEVVDRGRTSPVQWCLDFDEWTFALAGGLSE
jgi:hypothetical protein